MSRRQNYLARFAEPDSHAFASMLTPAADRPFRSALVIPAFDEADSCIDELTGNCDAPDILHIIVVNCPDTSSAQTRAYNRALTTKLAARRNPHWLVVDRVSQPLPRRQGVGLARKLGTDIALHLLEQGRLQTPWIYQTDADARLPRGYFDHPLPHAGTVVFAHRHRSEDPLLQRAAELYDAHSRRYHKSLTVAGSKYGYPTLGSTLVLHSDDYVKVRGYPKRNAAEDFHLLNKLAKVAPISVIDDIVIELQARCSHRVPFGTGPALERICKQLRDDPSGISYKTYHAGAFGLLARAIDALNAFADEPSLDVLATADNAGALLYELGWCRVASRFAAQYRRPAPRRKAVHDWFDALKTLRFIHLARRFFADQPMLEIDPTLRLDYVPAR